MTDTEVVAQTRALVHLVGLPAAATQLRVEKDILSRLLRGVNVMPPASRAATIAEIRHRLVSLYGPNMAITSVPDSTA